MTEMNLSWFNFPKPKFEYKPETRNSQPETRRLTIPQHQLVVQHPN